MSHSDRESRFFPRASNFDLVKAYELKICLHPIWRIISQSGGKLRGLVNFCFRCQFSLTELPKSILSGPSKDGPPIIILFASWTAGAGQGHYRVIKELLTSEHWCGTLKIRESFLVQNALRNAAAQHLSKSTNSQGRPEFLAQVSIQVSLQADLELDGLHSDRRASGTVLRVCLEISIHSTVEFLTSPMDFSLSNAIATVGI
jgi:hypothetical protein